MEDERPEAQPERENGRIRLLIRGFLKGLLFLLTIPTTLIAGAVFEGENPLSDPATIRVGVPFAAAILIMLLGHALAHYCVAKRHGVTPRWPWFFPAFNITGSGGIIDALPSNVNSDREVIRIGLAGPFVGFVISTVVLAIGLSQSEIASLTGQGPVLMEGKSLIQLVLSRLIVGPVPEGMDIALSPIAFAGWWGLWMTVVHLLPIDPYDGAYVVRGIMGDRAKWVVRVGLVALFGMGFLWVGWLSLATTLGIGLLVRRFWPGFYGFLFWSDPQKVSDELDLRDRRAYLLLILAIVVFALSFTPVPLELKVF
ncbi:MAG: site-2 protease family protein [Dehalococcoidia bacterium]